MFNKFVFGLLVLLVSTGMGLGIAKNIKTREMIPASSTNLSNFPGEYVWQADPSSQPQTGSALNMDQIATIGLDFAANYKTSIEIVRIIETSQYFYVVLRETATGIGAFELLVDPTTGKIGIENGPSQFWNTKYGLWGTGKSMSSGISAAQALNKAYLFTQKNNPAISIDPQPVIFYGYYSFFEKENDQIVGVISVNGFTGEVEPHTWLGEVLQTRDFNNITS